MNWNLEEDLLFKKIIEELKQYEKVEPCFYGWTVRISLKNSSQRLLYSNEKNELIPRVIRDNIIEKNYDLSVFTRDGDSQGYVNLTLDPAEEILPQIKMGIKNARGVNNPLWDLVSPVEGEVFDLSKTFDPVIKESPAKAADLVVTRASGAAASQEGVNVNYGELFVHYSRWYKVTSRGLKLPGEKSSLYFEIAMEKLPLPNTQEVHNNKSALTIEDLKIEEFVTQAALEAKVLGEVEMPATMDDGVILVRSDVISSIFNCLLAQADASREYLKQPCFKLGEKIPSGEQKGDEVHLTLDPGLDYMACSTPYTFEGLKAKKAVVIEDGLLKEQIVSNRMSQYLKKEVNPVTGNIVLEKGSSSYEELIKKAPKVIEIITFSSLLLNPNYLTYSSEIKLAREYDNTTGKIRYLKGGVVSGNIRENLSSCFFSNKETRYNVAGGRLDSAEGYVGPEYMLITGGVAIAGQ